jgi:hypothetical protein
VAQLLGGSKGALCATWSNDALSCVAPMDSKLIDGRPLADIGDTMKSLSMVRPMGEALALQLVLLLPMVLPLLLHAGECSGSLPAASDSFGGSGLMGGSEGLPEWVLSEPSSTPATLPSERGIRREAWYSVHQGGCTTAAATGLWLAKVTMNSLLRSSATSRARPKSTQLEVSTKA